ncbi:uncharacterized protein LOC120538473 isoform X3 [Polypterus senegalus]|uniref:uncharacterized protein LOC120538473 isoform X3 n=1 Tax=Polypterus senegalus TaxID=55291 RepID=UPI00196400E1|nr:uncharacterized protein LOC120538473 isoform X3 [Polypterus senegalus]
MASYTVYNQQGNNARYYVPSTVQGNPAGSRPALYQFSENQKKCLNGEPKALGYIISGSLSVASDRYHNQSLINGNLAMNIISSISSGIGIIFCGIDLIIAMDDYDRPYMYEHKYRVFQGSQLRKGVVGVLVVFLLLELCVSISSAAFSCKVLCCNDMPMTAGQQCDIQLTQHEVASASAPNYPATSQQISYNIPPPPPYLPTSL